MARSMITRAAVPVDDVAGIFPPWGNSIAAHFVRELRNFAIMESDTKFKTLANVIIMEWYRIFLFRKNWHLIYSDYSDCLNDCSDCLNDSNLYYSAKIFCHHYKSLRQCYRCSRFVDFLDIKYISSQHLITISHGLIFQLLDTKGI